MSWQQLMPREKLQQRGAEALTDAELLAIFLRTGSVGQPVMSLASQLLLHFGSLYQVMTADKQAMSAVKGVGDAKLAQLHAVAELGRRFFRAKMAREDVLANPQVTHQYLLGMLAHREREIFMVIFLDNQHRVIAAQEMFAGSINSVEVHPREIIREALKINAAALILAHNHPSGMPEPSAADRDITQQIINAGLLFNIRILDHLVVGHGQYVSFAERGWL
ncbi:DNA repair protein RadC [Pantoea sp. B65]